MNHETSPNRCSCPAGSSSRDHGSGQQKEIIREIPEGWFGYRSRCPGHFSLTLRCFGALCWLHSRNCRGGNPLYTHPLDFFPDVRGFDAKVFEIELFPCVFWACGVPIFVAEQDYQTGFFVQVAVDLLKNCCRARRWILGGLQTYQSLLEQLARPILFLRLRNGKPDVEIVDMSAINNSRLRGKGMRGGFLVACHANRRTGAQISSRVEICLLGNFAIGAGFRCEAECICVFF